MEAVSGGDEDLTYAACLTGERSDDLRRLFPGTEPSWFRDKGDVFDRPKNMFEAYRDSKIKPYVRSRDLNNSEDAPYENKPRTAFEFGIEIDF